MGAVLIEDDFLTARAVVEALETSEEGGPALDLRIGQNLSTADRMRVGTADAVLAAELLPETLEVILGDTVTPYTRSLDAAIPNEHIVFCMYSRARGRWVAVHRDRATGREYVSWAATEILARRAAALRGLAGISAAREDGDVVRFMAADHEAASKPDLRQAPALTGARTRGEDEPAWKVSF